MVTENANIVIAQLQADITTGKVYNARFKEYKDRLSWIIWKDKALCDLLLNSGDGSGGRTDNRTYPGISKLYNALPSNVHEVASAAKVYAKLQNELPATIIEVATPYFEYWLKVRELLVKTKPLIVMGRQPSANVSEADRRTLENTGTCPVCERNHKLNRGTMVAHGYVVEGREFVGRCFGVGELPWEVSKDGAIKFANLLARRLSNKQNLLREYRSASDSPDPIFDSRTRKYIHKSDVGYETLLKQLIAALDYEIKVDTRYFDRIRLKIEGWEPSTLPGILAGFAR
jgi:hypothetical protein